MFAERYAGRLFEEVFSLSFAMAYTVLVTATVGLILGEATGKKKWLDRNQLLYEGEYKVNNWYLVLLYLISTFLIFIIIDKTGGFTYWLSAPGDAFLNRVGSGVYVVLSHFFTYLLALLVGYNSYKNNNLIYLVIFIVWVLITSPVHGSKALIATFFVVSLIPWLRTVKLLELKSLLVTLSIVLIFYLGLYFRNVEMELENFLPYSLNYFSALDNLVVSLTDFNSGFMETFLLPFNKFTTIFGNDEGVYYDMNHYLTDIYYPHAWEIRATEQWPVETDLYLNFGFFGGLPLVLLNFFVVGYFYGSALIKNSLGSWFVAVLLMMSMMSHLRGSLYNHVDFYLYPMIIVLYLLTRRYYLGNHSN